MAFSDADSMDRHFQMKHNDQFWKQGWEAETRILSSEYDTKNGTPSLNMGYKMQTCGKSMISVLQHDVQDQIMQKKSESKNVSFYGDKKSIEEKDNPLSAPAYANLKASSSLETVTCTLEQCTQFSAGNDISKTFSAENPNVAQNHHVLQTKISSFKRVKIASSDHLEKRKITQREEKFFKCDVCGAEFNQNSNLKRHKRTHTGEKPFKCDVCGAGFTKNHILKSHKRTHTGERPFMCDVCGAGFTENYNLKSHKRTHTGERPFKCDVCVAAFTNSHSLNIHIRTHTGERPFKCDVCGAGFIENGRLKRHKRRHTVEKPFKGDVFGAGLTQTHLQKSSKEHKEKRKLSIVYVYI